MVFLLLYSSSAVLAQGNKKVSGKVTDTSNVAISDVNVKLISGKDTLQATTNADGEFSFSKIKADQFVLRATITGYVEFSKNYTFDTEKQLIINDVKLKFAANMLKEVVIKTKPNPIRIMQDTVEYNAAAYQVLEGDNVADLIKQFPGLEIDDEYNVKTMGKEMVKLRINGQDFFTSNVKDFIGRLPAGIVSKIQIIDDFGDEANFTGIKIGEPAKMLNIVTKPGMNKGKFGNAGLNGGTNDQIGSNFIMNLWNDSKQSSANVTYNTSNNGAGKAQNAAIMVTHSQKIGKDLRIGGNYGNMVNNNAFSSEQAIETLNPLGTFYNNMLSNGNSKSNNHSLNTTLNFNNKKVFLNGNISAGYSDRGNANSSFSNQSGIIRQDLRNINDTKGTAPRINANFNLSKVLKNKRNSFSANFGFSSSKNNTDQNIITNTLYYNKTTQVLEKDSLLNRILQTDNINNNVNGGFNYSLGLKKLKDTLARQSFNLSYNISIGQSESQVATTVFDNLNNTPSFVDSLSTHYLSTTINQSAGVNYNFNNKKMRYNLGLNLRPNLLRNNYINLNQIINNNTFNYSPNINFSRTISKGKTIAVNYSGSNINPSLYQLQPIRNAQNLQNIIVGNPDLKPAFAHNMSSSYNYVNAKTGISVQSGLSLSATQNEIINKIILIPDTLNSLKQETRFENASGNYSLASNYTLNIPIKKNKYSISYSGSFGFSNRAVFITNVKDFNEGINFTQQLNTTIVLKKVNINSTAAYTFSSNSNAFNQNIINDATMLGLGQINGANFFSTHNYRADVNAALRLKNLNISSNINYNYTVNNGELGANNFGDIQSLSLSLSTRATIKKSYRISVNTSKRINNGYALQNINPFIINANLSKSFFKNQALSININANDLLNQGNNLSRYVSGNSIIDSRMNQVTRVFTFGLSYNLSKFGGKNFYVDAD